MAGTGVPTRFAALVFFAMRNGTGRRPLFNSNDREQPVVELQTLCTLAKERPLLIGNFCDLFWHIFVSKLGGE
jgi:hypothetical protein